MGTHNRPLVMAARESVFLLLLFLSHASGAAPEKSPPPPDPSCPWVGLDCLFHNIVAMGSTLSWQECAAQCAAHKTCAYWSWRGADAWVNPYWCRLKSGCPQVVTDTTMVSGAYSCTQ